MGFLKKIAKRKSDRTTSAVHAVERMKEKIDTDVRISYLEQNIRDTRQYMKTVEILANVFTACARKKFKLSTPKIQALLDKVNSQMDCIKRGYVTAAEIRQALMDEIELELEPADQKEHTRAKDISAKAVQDITAAFMLSLLDEFGFKKLRLSRWHTMAARMVHAIQFNKVSVEQVSLMAAGKMKFSYGEVA
jgi:hypothetical protein